MRLEYLPSSSSLECNQYTIINDMSGVAMSRGVARKAYLQLGGICYRKRKKGLSWKEISLQINIHNNDEGQSVRQAAKAFAIHTGKTWPFKVKKEPYHWEVGKKGYDLRASGKSWNDVGREICPLHKRPADRIFTLAYNYAMWKGLLWPIPVPFNGDYGQDRRNLVMALRRKGLLFKEIGFRFFADCKNPEAAAAKMYRYHKNKETQ